MKEEISVKNLDEYVKKYGVKDLRIINFLFNKNKEIRYIIWNKHQIEGIRFYLPDDDFIRERVDWEGIYDEELTIALKEYDSDKNSSFTKYFFGKVKQKYINEVRKKSNKDHESIEDFNEKGIEITSCNNQEKNESEYNVEKNILESLARETGWSELCSKIYNIIRSNNKHGLHMFKMVYTHLMVCTCDNPKGYESLIHNRHRNEIFDATERLLLDYIYIKRPENINDMRSRRKNSVEISHYRFCDNSLNPDYGSFDAEEYPDYIERVQPNSNNAEVKLPLAGKYLIGYQYVYDIVAEHKDNPKLMSDAWVTKSQKAFEKYIPRAEWAFY